jgi:hypothetical protein
LVFRVLHIDGPCFVYAYNIGIFMRILNPKNKKISAEISAETVTNSIQFLLRFCFYDHAAAV